MLFAKTTPKGTGIEFWGDYNDLASLYDTIIKLSDLDCNHERNRHVLPIIRLQISSALKGNELKNNSIENGLGQTSYYGFRLDWITLLYSISALRYNAGMLPTDEIDQCNLMQLEYWTRKTLEDYDPEGAKFLKLFINKRIDVADEHIGMRHHSLLIKYFSIKPGKKRFRYISSLLVQKYSYTNIYIPDCYDEYDIIW